MKRLPIGDDSNVSTDEVDLQNVLEEGDMEFNVSMTQPQTIQNDQK